MARRRHDFMKLAQKIEAGFLAPFIVGVARSAQAVVKDLQELGPVWSGEFSNSWEIASASKVSSGSGSSGPPQRILAPILTVDEYKFKPEIKYYIANKAPHADIALDLAEGRFWPNGQPIPTRKIVQKGSRPVGPHKRGQVSPGTGSATSSAQQDWYTRYLQEKRIDKTISLYMDQALRNVKL